MSEHRKSLSWASGFLRPYKALIIILTGIVLISSLISMVLPLLNKQIIDEGIMKLDLYYTVTLIGLSILLGLIDKGFQLLQAKYYAVIASRVPFDIQMKVFKKLLKLKIDFYNDVNATQLLSTINMDINNVCLIADQSLIFMISDLLKMCGSLVGLFLINPFLALIGLLVVPVKIIINVKQSVQKGQAFDESIAANQDFFGWFGDALNGVKEIKLLEIKKKMIRKFVKLQRPIIRTNAKFIRLDQWHNFWDFGLSDWVTDMIFLIGAVLVIKQALSLGALIAFTSYLAAVYTPASTIINLRYMFSGFFPSAKRLEELLSREEEETLNVKKPIFPLLSLDKPVIDFQKVGFTYPGGVQALKNISFSIAKGEKVAIIGANGSGKTTIINLLLGLYRPTTGKIKIFGQPLEEIPLKQLRQMVAAVTQDAYIFDMTIRENINLCQKKDCYDDNALSIWRKMLNNLIRDLPEGLETPVGQNGVNVSGGQRQRIVIARALLRKSPIILMDEATSQLDINSEREINQVLCDLPNEVTALIITHRPYILERVDKIIVVDDGKVVAVGSHGQLINFPGFYKQFIKAHDCS